MAWLSAIPKGAKQSRIKSIELASESQGCEPDYDLPDIGDAEYLVSYLSEVGEGQADGGNLRPTNWSDFDSWIGATGTRLTAGEVVAMKRLSVAYVAQYNDSFGAGCPPPSINEAPQKEVVENKMKMLFSMLRGSKKDD